MHVHDSMFSPIAVLKAAASLRIETGAPWSNSCVQKSLSAAMLVPMLAVAARCARCADDALHLAVTER